MSDTLRDQVRQVLAEEIAPALQLDGSAIEVLEVRDGVAQVRIGSCGCCPATLMTVIHGIEQELRRRVPGVEYIEAVP